MKFHVNLKYHLPAHKDCIYTCLKLNESCFLTGGGDGQLLKWDLSDTSSANLIAKTDSSIYLLEHINEHTIAIGTNSGDLFFYDHTKKKVISEFKLGHGIFTALVNQHSIYMGCANGFIIKISKHSLKIELKKQVSEAHIRTIIRQSNELILVGTSANEILVFDEMDLVKRIDSAHNDSIFSLLSIDKNYFLSGGKDAIMKLWDAKSFKPLIEIPSHLFAVNDLVHLGSENKIVSASRDKSIKIWDAETLLLDKVIDRTKIELASSHSVNKLLMLSKSLLVAVGDDRIVRVYEVTKL
ncbi:MAG: hypothetical protein JXQ87_14370 [Bacteroidia bacterium]